MGAGGLCYHFAKPLGLSCRGGGRRPLRKPTAAAESSVNRWWRCWWWGGPLYSTVELGRREGGAPLLLHQPCNNNNSPAWQSSRVGSALRKLRGLPLRTSLLLGVEPLALEGKGGLSLFLHLSSPAPGTFTCTTTTLCHALKMARQRPTFITRQIKGRVN